MLLTPLNGDCNYNMSEYIKFCPNCNRTGLNISKFFNDEEIIEFYKGYLFFNKIENENSKICPCCKKADLIDSILTIDEFTTIQKFTQNRQVLESMVELKKNDIIEFELKLNQFKLQQKQKDNVFEKQRQENLVHCPYCNSTDIKKITGTERAVSVGMLGLFSKKLNKSFKCKNCGGTF